jgi:mono/diheme cytochrome c family protein
MSLPAFRLAALLAAGLLASACNKGGAPSSDQAARGRILYSTSCIACHNADPSKDGTLGPAISGSSLELLQARVLRAEYPPGYTPKRATKLMVKLPLTEPDVAALHAFLNSAAP